MKKSTRETKNNRRWKKDKRLALVSIVAHRRKIWSMSTGRFANEILLSYANFSMEVQLIVTDFSTIKNVTFCRGVCHCLGRKLRLFREYFMFTIFYIYSLDSSKKLISSWKYLNSPLIFKNLFKELSRLHFWVTYCPKFCKKKKKNT